MRRAVPYRRVMLGLVAALIAAFLVGVAVGAVWISPIETIRLIAWKVGLTARPEDVSRAAEVILFPDRGMWWQQFAWDYDGHVGAHGEDQEYMGLQDYRLWHRAGPAAWAKR